MTEYNSIITVGGKFNIEIWKKHKDYLKKCFWKEYTFWSDGYFVYSIGEANPKTIKKCIENQG